MIATTAFVAVMNQGFATEGLYGKFVVIADFIYEEEPGCLNIFQLTAIKPMTSMAFMCRGTEVAAVSFCYEEASEFTKSVTDMHDMFFEATKLVYVNLTNLDTRSVTNMENMFRLCVNLKEVNFSGFNTSNVTRRCRQRCSDRIALKISKKDNNDDA